VCNLLKQLEMVMRNVITLLYEDSDKGLRHSGYANREQSSGTFSRENWIY